MSRKSPVYNIISVPIQKVKPNTYNPNTVTPEYLNIPENARKMLQADIEAERAAISQYEAHIRTIKDCYVNAVLARIIKDEEYHIILLKALMKEIK